MFEDVGRCPRHFLPMSSKRWFQKLAWGIAFGTLVYQTPQQLPTSKMPWQLDLNLRPLALARLGCRFSSRCCSTARRREMCFSTFRKRIAQVKCTRVTSLGMGSLLMRTWFFSYSQSGWPDVRDKVAQNSARRILWSKSLHNVNRGTKMAKNVGYFCKFLKSAESKQWPSGLKFAQSGHPVHNVESGVRRW
jgi:hypothetical protein